MYGSKMEVFLENRAQGASINIWVDYNQYVYWIIREVYAIFIRSHFV
jgi:hypothetical protein